MNLIDVVQNVSSSCKPVGSLDPQVAMDPTQEEEEIVPLSNRISLKTSKLETSQTSKTTKRLPNEGSSVDKSKSKPVPTILEDLGDTKKSIENSSDEEESQESSFPENESKGDKSQEGFFSGSTKFYLIFLACIFGTLLFVWWIGGPDEETIDHLDQQYSILGLDPSARDDQVRSAFKKLALQFHPDKCKGADCAKNFIDIEKARDTILKWGDYFRARRVVQPQRAM